METGTVLFLSLISLWALRGLLSGNSTTTLLKKFPELRLPRYKNGDPGGAAHWIRTMPEIFVTAPGSPFGVRNHDRLFLKISSAELAHTVHRRCLRSSILSSGNQFLRGWSSDRPSFSHMLHLYP